MIVFLSLEVSFRVVSVHFAVDVRGCGCGREGMLSVCVGEWN